MNPSQSPRLPRLLQASREFPWKKFVKCKFEIFTDHIRRKITKKSLTGHGEIR